MCAFCAGCTATAATTGWFAAADDVVTEDVVKVANTAAADATARSRTTQKAMSAIRPQRGPRRGAPTSATGAARRLVGDRRGRRERLVLCEDRTLELAQRRTRLETELFVQHPFGGAIGIERVCLPAAAVEREDLLAAQTLAQRVRAYERAELGHELGVAPAFEVCVDTALDRRKPQLVERRCLTRREGRLDIAERRPAEETVGLTQQPRPRGEVRRRARLCDERAKPIEVELARLDAHEIARSLCDESVAEHLAKPRDLVLQRALRVLRRRLPEVDGEAIR